MKKNIAIATQNQLKNTAAQQKILNLKTREEELIKARRDTREERASAYRSLVENVIPTLSGVPRPGVFRYAGLTEEVPVINEAYDAYVEGINNVQDSLSILKDPSSTTVQVRSALKEIINVLRLGVEFGKVVEDQTLLNRLSTAAQAIGVFMEGSQARNTAVTSQNMEAVAISNARANAINMVNEALNKNEEALNRNIQNINADTQARLNNASVLTPAQQIAANQAVAQAKGYGRYYATGGPIGTDTVNAWLTPGEFVVNRAATKRNFALLSAMNSGHRPNYYASGGVVNNNFNNTFNQTTSPNSRMTVRKSAVELRRQIGLGTVTLAPKNRIPI